MMARSHSRTAEATAAIRASHLLYDQPPIFVDPYAIELTSALWRVVCRNRLLHWAVVRGLLGRLRPVHGWILVRDQITEDSLRDFVARGFDQYVLLGAGFDSIALRRPEWLRDVRIIEVDHPATQAVKLARMAAIPHSAALVDFEAVAMDFERDHLSTSLARSRFTPGRPAFFAWQGVIYYLTAAAIRDTLAAIAEAAAPGSELMFDYLLPEHARGAADGTALSLARRVTSRMGENYISYHTPEAVGALLDACGFDLVELFTDSRLAATYCAARSDDLSVMPGFGVALARRRAAGSQ